MRENEGIPGVRELAGRRSVAGNVAAGKHFCRAVIFAGFSTAGAIAACLPAKFMSREDFAGVFPL
ncbi:MAG TPA: hypothetical protein DC058_19615 [Planctomycetaceae bacterium]|nr:hypothetical protein [Planctomycetaceae bacterium]HBC63406.1 hypothetical protein [Planctomycetaceae bacterium]